MRFAGMGLAARMLLACLLLAGCGSHRVTFVLLSRHAEKAAGNDPPITEAGREYADALGLAAEGWGVSRIYVTQYRRTQETAAPAADRLDLVPIVVEAGADMDAHAAAVAGEVQRCRGAVLVVGHSNTIPAIIECLGVPNPPTIGEDEYGDVFEVTLEEGRVPAFARFRYRPRDGKPYFELVSGE